MNYSVVLICLVVALVRFEAKRFEPKPIPLGTGDTLMVRIVGYGFCPSYCEIDHNHIGHYKNYDCEELQCEHITINEK